MSLLFLKKMLRTGALLGLCSLMLCAMPGFGTHAVALVKRGWKSFLLNAGTVFFGEIATGAYYVKALTCNEAAMVAIIGANVEGAVACIGAYVVGAAAAAIFAGLAAEGGSAGWVWWKGSGIAKRDTVITQELPLANMTLYGGPAVTSYHIDYLNQTLGKYFENVGFVSKAGNGLEDGITKRSILPEMVVWRIEESTHNVTVLVADEHFEKSVTAYRSYIDSNYTYFGKRDDGEWLSYNTYGFNVAASEFWALDMKEDANAAANDIGNMVVSQIQPCTETDCYGVENKFCASWGDSETMGDRSIIVGEVYIAAYGGIDTECQSG
ncbi:hypothetical protein KAFR_0E00110 [Kazachstania africana CBS 2517]|uniref:Uncharacterized protein n=1 Tax=Kazachstania africana (strain ATCC 22294 / BCRC 22015 / CBS 2517 / CECT 1963 / NBRC 1671 / NRRL Y-8276) TaxID=1071382 RepID=H2AUW4_KAZAF|nr:hypothetical protein KAFR_0E00110 [Kazachstania africana CBS 2517]CCF58164.1 hypothetical protein KAFR_0E00110 [Kazachstania africana CBS 2517]